MSSSLLLAMLSCAYALSQQGNDPAPCFEGTGGPGGDFDWVVRSGEVFILDTTQTLIVGGPDGLPTTTQLVVNGVLDVNDLTIEESALVLVQGPNPVRVLATGDVTIRGTLDLSGFSGRSVATLNTGNQVEPGGLGVAGGGRGGNANLNTTGSTPRGGDGLGAFQLQGGGGQGGESGFSTLGKNERRPGGGGGGRFVRDLALEPGLLASAGGDGHPDGTGAESGVMPAAGGAPGAGPFQDGDPDNDFFGVKPVRGPGGRVVGLLRGELPTVWAGAGGGAGGNAIPADEFPNPAWSIASDEKGGPGGGGGGGLHVQALGRIVFGAAGEIRADGGLGGLGENTNFLDHVGGTGASGSGGHVVLESALQIDFTDGGTNTAAPLRDWISAVGQGAQVGPTQWLDPCCLHLSRGGGGGPGLVQLHVPDPTKPPGDTADAAIRVPSPYLGVRDPLSRVASPGALALFTTCDGPAVPLHTWLGGRDRGSSFLRLLLPAVTGPGAEEGLARDVPHLEMAPLPHQFPRRP